MGPARTDNTTIWRPTWGPLEPTTLQSGSQHGARSHRQHYNLAPNVGLSNRQHYNKKFVLVCSSGVYLNTSAFFKFSDSGGRRTLIETQTRHLLTGGFSSESVETVF
ncbi:hypothetical protein CDAR_44751 [Caerostris darwini]|uniref:Uncharacterized protein n=1 Tax=Caerostris darwini TaxID=1538125 RepID=A0AAV4SP61_9ARAC|nr:hypothetical protein CDAR_44751 [Caerostris darwini]